MVSNGFAMLGIGLWSLYARFHGSLYDLPWLHSATVIMGPSGFAAVLAGWITTEVGRQPYVIYGLLHTADAASPLDTPAVAASLLAFIIVYFAVFGIGVWYILKLVGKAPQAGEYGVKRGDTGPIRGAGITRGPTQIRAAQKRFPHTAPLKGSLRDGSYRHLGLRHRPCDLCLCGDGRVRSGKRHPVSDLPAGART